ncbi:MAG: hypothetical protein [Wendovervirus sonii]|uniref:Uncharacterized protein n=1 Tax=phage Lak_Megaphage_Sonny TaxID=3109229 RepID=A0ABZ0Z5T8_9CAUD|nr:MAG: hypothetical protein [phage Lak_Megaphage_Sonny]
MNKKYLYESIMKNVSHEVKKVLNERYSNDIKKELLANINRLISELDDEECSDLYDSIIDHLIDSNWDKKYKDIVYESFGQDLQTENEGKHILSYIIRGHGIVEGFKLFDKILNNLIENEDHMENGWFLLTKEGQKTL